MPLHRRSLLAGALTLGAAQAFPGLSHAQARKLVFATFTGSWEEAHGPCWCRPSARARAAT